MYRIYEKEDPDAAKFTVTFLDWDDKVVKEIKVSSGGSIADADLPNTATLVRDGYLFIGWDRNLTNITENITTKAVYKALSEDDIVVRYINSVTKEVFYQTTIKKGTVAPSIQTPTVSGYTFKEWLPDLQQLSQKIQISMQYMRQAALIMEERPVRVPAPAPEQAPVREAIITTELLPRCIL